jgi:hypothetical protein
MRPTDRKRKPRAVKEEATQLWSKIIRTTRGPLCEARWFYPETCHGLAQDAAHIVPRGPAHTRTDLGNGFALCKSCHGHFGLYITEWQTFVDRTMGEGYLHRMEQQARLGVAVKFDWFDELDRLRAIAADLGIGKGAA